MIYPTQHPCATSSMSSISTALVSNAATSIISGPAATPMAPCNAVASAFYSSASATRMMPSIFSPANAVSSLAAARPSSLTPMQQVRFVRAPEGSDIAQFAAITLDDVAGQSVKRVVINTQHWTAPLVADAALQKTLAKMAKQNDITISLKMSQAPFVYEFEPVAASQESGTVLMAASRSTKKPHARAKANDDGNTRSNRSKRGSDTSNARFSDSASGGKAYLNESSGSSSTGGSSYFFEDSESSGSARDPGW